MNTLAIAHDFLGRQVPRGGFCIDATAGRGRDTELLCRLVGEEGRVLALDIQPQAVRCTRERLESAGLSERARVICDSHSNLKQYAQEDSADAIVFNFGYLPGGDHSIYTRPETSIAAIDQGLDILKPGGVMSLCIYYGGDTGYEERDRLLEHLHRLDSRRYTVLLCDFVNRPHDPPLAAFIWRDA